MGKYNVGMIGYGWASGAHIEAINNTGKAQVTHVYSSRKMDDGELSSRHGGKIQSFTDLAVMLADPELHVVSICSFPNQHAQQAIAAAKAGKHLIIEKPLALSWQDCLAVQKAVEENKVQASVCFECRFSSQFLATKAVIDQGLLGDIHYGEVDYYHGIGPWYGQYRWNTKLETGGSSLLSAGCHALDALLLCMQSEVVSVSSFSSKSKNAAFTPYEYPTSSVTILKFKDGRIGKVASIIDCLQPYYFHVHLVGSKGSLLDNKFHSEKISGLNKAEWSALSMKMLDSGDVSDHPYQAQFNAFFESLARGVEMPLTSLKAALETHRVIFAADESARTGSPVNL